MTKTDWRRGPKLQLRIDIAGQRFGLLTAIQPSGRTSRYGVYWECRCDCGSTIERLLAHLRNAKGTQSCGCHHWALKQGHSRRSGEHPMYQMWLGMRARCSQEGHKNYADYGGRGIKVCERWMDFDTFLADVGERPADPPDWLSRLPYWSLDRIDMNGDYEPGNVRWATWKQQANNRRKRRPRR